MINYNLDYDVHINKIFEIELKGNNVSKNK